MTDHLLLTIILQAICLFPGHSLKVLPNSEEFENHDPASNSLVKRLFSGPALSPALTDAPNPYNETHRSLMLEGCGEICDTTITGTMGKFFNTVHKRVDCMALYANEENDAAARMWPPPREIPESMKQDYTLNGTLPVNQWYITQRYSGTTAREAVWTAKEIQENIEQAKAGTLVGSYGIPRTTRVRNFLQKHQDAIKGKHFFTIGSEHPWLEALLLEAGAEHVTTIEYGSIRSEHPRVSTMIPAEVRKMYLDSSTKPLFDGGATYSSIEHSGLGRYGDALNPWGDLQAMAKAWCITKEGGQMFAGVPTGPDDAVYWNAHRMYGKRRWPQLMANWEQEDRESDAFDKIGLMHYFTKLTSK